MPGTIPATSQLDRLISMTAINVLAGSRAMRDRLKLFNVCMGSSIGSQRTMDAISTPPPHSIFRTAARTRFLRSSAMVISSLGPGLCGKDVDARRLIADPHETVGSAVLPRQQKPALDERLGDHLGVVAIAEHVPPGLRQDPPLTIAPLTVDVAEAVDNGSAVHNRIW